MKIFHLSDLHIGLKLFNHELYEDQKIIFEQVAEYAKKEQPDAVLIAGDIYDKAVPSAEAMEVFDFFISAVHKAAPKATIMMISGNHDSATRVNTYRGILSENNFYMIGNPPSEEDDHIEVVTIEDEFGPVNFYLLPFVKPSMVKKIVGVNEEGNNLSYNEAVHKLVERENIDTTKRNVFVSHQFYIPANASAADVERMDSEIRTVGNIDEVKADVLEAFDYAALGHIHKPMKVGKEVYRYCGTPMACSVSEAGQDKGIVMVEMGAKGEVDTKVLPLVPLHKVRVIKGLLQDVLKEKCDDYVTLIITDGEDLNVIDMQERLRFCFPNHLEIKREMYHKSTQMRGVLEEDEPDLFEMCCSFMDQIDEEGKELLMDVINAVKEA